MPSLLTLETKKYDIKLENFEGPLDLLCSLVEKNKMSIYDIKLDEITDQYLEYLNTITDLNLEIASEFLTMASTLLYIKSKKLLPDKTEDVEDVSEDELIRRIIEYKKYKEISIELKNNFEINSLKFFKIAESIKLPNQVLEEKYNSNIIPEIYLNLWKKNKNKINENAKNIEKIAITENYNVVDKVKDMFRELIRHKSFVFNKMFSINEHSKQEIVTAFMGLLELSRRNKVETKQEELFGDVNVKRKK